MGRRTTIIVAVVAGIVVLAIVGAIIDALDGSDQEPTVTSEAPTAATETEPEPEQATTSPIREYPGFEDVDPFTSLYFISLEPTTLAADQGEQRLWGLGVGVCRNLDRGNSIDDEIGGLVDDARLTVPDASSLVGAAVGSICDHHGPSVEAWLEANS